MPRAPNAKGMSSDYNDAQGRRLENFTRVETFGDNQGNGNNDVNWLRVLVDPRSREVLAYQPQIVPARMAAATRWARRRRASSTTDTSSCRRSVVERCCTRDTLPSRPG